MRTSRSAILGLVCCAVVLTCAPVVYGKDAKTKEVVVQGPTKLLLSLKVEGPSTLEAGTVVGDAPSPTDGGWAPGGRYPQLGISLGASVKFFRGHVLNQQLEIPEDAVIPPNTVLAKGSKVIVGKKTNLPAPMVDVGGILLPPENVGTGELLVEAQFAKMRASAAQKTANEAATAASNAQSTASAVKAETVQAVKDVLKQYDLELDRKLEAKVAPLRADIQVVKENQILMANDVKTVKEEVVTLKDEVKELKAQVKELKEKKECSKPEEELPPCSITCDRFYGPEIEYKGWVYVHLMCTQYRRDHKVCR